ncbi:IS66 family insertion sequence element accessory protein TnpB [Roseibium sp.]|uniref:IS66 family insertion sequence element accessory protein TnpB n=1 Tax=Roseibium sp. TaxID=1936156 RepID=UPI003B510F54
MAYIAQDVLRQKPASGAVFAFHGRCGDRIKLLYCDGQGFYLYCKVLERGRFTWPSVADGTTCLTSAQLAMLWEGMAGAALTGACHRLGLAKLSI